MRLTDRRTDRQRTEGRTDSFLIARPRLHSMQRGKNDPFLAHLIYFNVVARQLSRLTLTLQYPPLALMS